MKKRQFQSLKTCLCNPCVQFVYKVFKTYRFLSYSLKEKASTNAVLSTFVDALGLSQLNWKRPGYTRGRT